MEDHLKDKDRLMKEWNALRSYQAEPSAVTVGQSESHLEQNRCPESLPCESHLPLLGFNPLVLGWDSNIT